MAESPYAALRSSGAVVDPRRVVVGVEGPDAAGFLQGQCSQDLTSVAPGSSVWSWVLQPAGKVEALVRVSRGSGDDWYLDTDSGWGEAVVARLSRFKLRTKVDIGLLDWRVVGIRGVGLAAPTVGGGTAVVADATWGGLEGWDLLGPAPEPPGGLPVVAAREWDAARIEAGLPVMGADIDERTIPGETGLVERTVSFTKGCYTGQELVARIDSRGGNVPRRLLGVRSPHLLEAGASLVVDGATVGTVTSASLSPTLGPVALGYVKRATPVGATVEVPGGEATVVALPMPSV